MKLLRRASIVIASLFLLVSCSAILAQSRGTASISGTVSLEGKPSAGIKVLANHADLDPANKDTPPIVAITDDAGHYIFKQLEEGKYVITAAAPAFVDARPKGDGFRQARITISAAESADKVDFVLKRGAVVTGRVTDFDGRPLIAEPVSILSVDASGAITPLRRFISTDDEGSYRAYGLMPGRYIIASGADPNRDSPSLGAYERTYYPAAAEIKDATILEVTAEKEITGIDIKTKRRKKTFQASGRIIDADTGAPVTGLSILLARITTPDAISEMRAGTADQKGNFLIEGLHPGKYAVNIQNLSSLNYYQDPYPFEVGDSDVSDMEIPLHKGSVITGTLLIQVEPNATASPVPVHLSISSVKPQLPIWFLSFSNTTVNGSGSFQIGGVRPGIVKLYISPESDTLKLVKLERDGIPLGDTITVSDKENISGLRAVLAVGTSSIQGELDFDGGEVPDNLTFYIEINSVSGRAGRVEPDSRGKFQIDNLLPGSYDLTVRSMKVRPELDKPNFKISPVSKTVQVENGSETRISIKIDLNSREVIK